MKFKILASSFVMVGLVATLAQAGSMTTMMTASNRFDPITFADLGPVLSVGGRVANAQSGVFQIQVTFTAQADAGEKGWANTLFDTMAMNNAGGSLLTLRPDLNYDPNAATFDSNGAAPGGVVPVYGTNTDAGAPGDLQGILASIASATIQDTATDTRNKLGTPQAPSAAGVPGSGTGNPSYIGSFFVEWNGLGTADLAIKNQQYSFTTTNNEFGPTQTGNGAALGFGTESTIPEPATVTLLGLAMLGGLGLVRRRS